MTPTLSIIIPLYNAASTLDRCLESILSQSLRDIEVVCVNDGSTDESQEILKQWSKRDKRVRLRRFEGNNGIIFAVKLGLRESTGEYIMFADADDRLLPGACENAVRQIREYDVDILRFGAKVIVPPGTDDTLWKKHHTSIDWTSEGTNILYDCYSMHRFPHNIWNKIYRGEVCRKAGASMPDLRLRQATDVYLTFFFLYYAKTFRSVATGTYYEYYVGNGVSTCLPTEKSFADICASSQILTEIEGFLRRENALEANKFLLESIKNLLLSGVINRMVALPEITRETVRLAVESWGTDLIYNFIEATGLLSVKCETRYHLIQNMTEQIRRLNRERASIRGKSISIGGMKGSALPPGTKQEKNSTEDKK